MHPQLDLKQISIELLKVFNKLTFPVTSLQEVQEIRLVERSCIDPSISFPQKSD